MQQRSVSRAVFASAAASALGSIAILRSPARAATEWKCNTNAPAGNPEAVRLTQAWDEVKRLTDGRVVTQVFPGSQLGDDAQTVSQTRSGAIQFTTISGPQIAALVPVAAIEGIGFAFTTTRQAFSAMDGPLGQYVRKEISAKGMYVFEKEWNVGFREITSSTRPITVAKDLEGFKIRTPPSKMWLDLFSTLGASPTPIDPHELYVSLQTKVVDGEENPPVFIDSFKLYEVQKYLSVTNHMWTGKWLIANPEAMSSLSAGDAEIVNRTLNKYALLQRVDFDKVNASLMDTLRQKMTVNVADVSTFRARLGPYYTRWKTEFGETPWSMLEATSGKLA